MAVDLNNMKTIFLFLTLFYVATEGNTTTGCIANDGRNLNCIFPENINKTRKDFTVYFYPNSGGEEALLDCAWVHENLDCIVQEGFACKESVSENAIISVPTRFANRTGSFRCKTDSYVLEPCRFTKSEERGQNSTCEAHTLSEGCQVTVNCTFPVEVDIFMIEINSTVVATYNKSSCQASGPCQHQAGDRRDVFTVKLDKPECLDGTYRCTSVQPTLVLEAKVCTASIGNPTERPPVAVVAVISVVCVTATATAAVVVAIIIQRRRKAKLQNDDHRERAQEESLFIHSVRSVPVSTEMS